MTAGTTGLRRAGTVLAAIVATSMLLAGCAAGQRAQTSNEISVVDGSNAKVGSIQLRDIALAAPTASGGYATGGSAPLVLSIVNDGNADDQLVAVSSPVAAAVTSSTSQSAAASAESSASAPTGSSGPSGSSSSSGSASATPIQSSSSAASAPFVSIACPAGQLKRVSSGQAAQVTITLLQLRESLVSGQSLAVTFTFKSSGSVTVQIPVQLGSGGSAAPTIDIQPSGD